MQDGEGPGRITHLSSFYIDRCVVLDSGSLHAIDANGIVSAVLALGASHPGQNGSYFLTAEGHTRGPKRGLTDGACTAVAKTDMFLATLSLLIAEVRGGVLSAALDNISKVPRRRKGGVPAGTHA